MVIWQGILQGSMEIIEYAKTIPGWIGAGLVAIISLVKTILGRSRMASMQLRLDVDQATPFISALPTVRVYVTNAGTNKVNVKNIYVKFGRFRKTNVNPVLHQMRTDPTLPRILEESATVEIDLKMDALAIQLKKAFQDPKGWNGARSESAFLSTVKVGVITSTGKSFEQPLHLEKFNDFMSIFRIAEVQL